MASPDISKQWVVRTGPDSKPDTAGFTTLVQEKKPVPPLGEYEVLVHIRAVSLNWRDAKVASNTYPRPVRDGVVPCSDGCGDIVNIGPKVTRLSQGTRVAALFVPAWQSGRLREGQNASALGANRDGMLREYAVFNENDVVEIPQGFSYEEGCTLPCAALTAWSSLMGGRRVEPGDTVVTQGTGGVSLFAVQFALAAGAEVISTTSSERKAGILRDLGVSQVINYKETPGWGVAAKKASRRGLGADFVVEIGGPETMQQSLKVLKPEGEICMVGQRSAQDPKGTQTVTADDIFSTYCSIRRVGGGSRQHFEDMIRAIETSQIRPVIDETIFEFDQARDAFKHLWHQRHIGKIVIRV